VEVRMKRKRERKDKGKGKGKCTNDPSWVKDPGRECDCFLAQTTYLVKKNRIW
jgi:hypothetical protein